MADTITAFYTFSAGSKARSANVNTNFSNFRGHNIPIDPNTATGIALTYDLGTTEYRWRDYYGRGLNLIGMTTTANLGIARDNAATNGSYPILIGGTEVARLDSTATSFRYSGSEVGRINALGAGFQHQYTTASFPTWQMSTVSAGFETVSAMTINTGGYPALIMVQGVLSIKNATGTGSNYGGQVQLVVDGSVCAIAFLDRTELIAAVALTTTGFSLTEIPLNFCYFAIGTTAARAVHLRGHYFNNATVIVTSGRMSIVQL